jgi:hypothetical protein
VTELKSRTTPELLSSCRHISTTVIEKEHEAAFARASVAVQTTVVVPSANEEPEGGVQLAVAPPQLSLAAGAE